MNDITGKLVELYIKNGTTMGKVNVGGAYLCVPMFFILDAKIGDTISIEAGIAISVYQEEEETAYVLGNSGQSHLN